MVGSSETESWFLRARIHKTATPPKQNGRFQWNRGWVHDGKNFIICNATEAKWSIPEEPRVGSCLHELQSFATPLQQNGRFQWNRDMFLTAGFHKTVIPLKQNCRFQWNREWVPDGTNFNFYNTSEAKWSVPVEPRVGS